MAKFSNDGAGWMGQKIGFGLNGILGAIACVLLDWLLPSWMKDIYITWNHLYGARAMDRNLTVLAYSRKARLAYFIVPAICISTFKVCLVPAGRELLFYQGAVRYALVAVLTTIAYLQSDGTPDEQRLSMFAHRDAGICYFSTAYSLIHRWWFWKLLCSAFVWILLPLACLSAGMWILWDKLPQSFKMAPLLLFVKAAGLFMKSWDLFDKLEAHLTERIPKWLQYRLHRYQLEHRKQAPLYVYSPLQPGEIRLLRLKRTNWWLPGSVEAELIHVSMYPLPEYEAVSYRWGSSERPEDIVLDGARFRVTRSAYDLLMARRSVWRPRTIWIDAICINQSDDVEKAAQVQLMRDIYHRAKRVVIFTGADWTARLAAPLLYETVAATVQFDASILELNKLTSSEKLTTKWKALKKLVLDDYFTRAWVVQEVAVGQRVELYYGGLYISWSVFLKLAMLLAHPHRREMLTLGDRDDHSPPDSGSLENIAIMSFLRPDGTESGFGNNLSERTGLEAVLFSTFTFRATDPRDKVFAVLGISRYDDNEGLLVPDYSKSISQVYRDTAEHLFFHNDKPSSSMLALAGTGHSIRRLSMPSWVPDLDQQRLWFPYTDFVSQEGTFKASGGTAAEIRRGKVPDSLAIRGVFCDVVRSMGITTVHEGDLEPGPQLDATYVTRFKHEIFEDTTMCIQKHNALWPDAMIDANAELWLALVGGRISRKRPFANQDWNNVSRHWTQTVQRLAELDNDGSVKLSASHNPVADQNLDIAEGELATYDSSLDGCYGRRFAITKQGRLCWVPPYAELGDIVFIPFGAQTPFLVRANGQTDGEEVFELVGESYVQGIMWGELMEGEYQEAVITLV